MRRILTTLLLLVLTAATAHARQTPPADGARMVDEFGDILVTDWLARLDNFAVELQNDPSAMGYIVAYMAPNKLPGWPLRRAQWARGYLAKARGLDEGRVQIFNGGQSDEHRYQLWVVTPGGNLPVAPFDFAAALAREKGAYLFDRYTYYPIDTDKTGIEHGYAGYLDERGHYASFAEALRYDPAARGSIIAYASRRQRRGSDRRLAAQVKRELLRSHAVSAERVIAIGGGQRRERTIELWIVPPGAELPKPSTAAPPARPKRR